MSSCIRPWRPRAARLRTLCRWSWASSAVSLGDPRAGTLDSPGDGAIFQFDLDEPNHVFIRALAQLERRWDPSSTRLRMDLLTERGDTVDMHQRHEPFPHDSNKLQESLTSTTFLDAGRYYLRLRYHKDDQVPFIVLAGNPYPLPYFLLALTTPRRSRSSRNAPRLARHPATPCDHASGISMPSGSNRPGMQAIGRRH